MELTEPDNGILVEITYAKERLSALPQTANIVNALGVLDEARNEYHKALAAVNAVEQKIGEYEKVAKNAASERNASVGAVPSPANLAKWSADRQRLQLLIKDTGEVIDQVVANELTPAKSALADISVNIRATVSQVAGVEYGALQSKLDGGQALTDVEQRRYIELKMAALNTPSIFNNEPPRSTSQPPAPKW